ncbi:MAG: tRNA pseudouridine(13) synthase TruD, partial [Woeseiaceae bacterium]
MCSAIIRTQASDFIVDEVLGFSPDGEGEHDFLVIRKTGANTAWVARQLAHYAGIPARDVGYGGLKDRHAITTQAFTVRRPGRAAPDWSRFVASGVEIRAIARHGRKLRRGAHKGNRFRIRLRGKELEHHSKAISERIAVIRELGIPNYFGEQRFGHGGRNLELARSMFAGKRLKRDKRSIAISAARSYIFNRTLDARVRDGSWNSLRAGDLANLDGTGS